MKKTKLIEKECGYCHKKYTIAENARKRLKYCSKECHLLAQKTRRLYKTCSICGKYFQTTTSVNAKYCSKICYNKAKSTPEHQAIYKKTMMARYGSESALSIPEFLNKAKETCLRNHGVEYSLKSKSIWEKGRKTCKERYGTEFPQKTLAVKEKIKKTCQDRYGASSILGNKDFRDNLRKKLLEKYGVDNYMSLHMPVRAQQVFSKKEALVNYIKSFKETNNTTDAVFMYNDLGVDDTTFYAYLDKYDLRSLVTHSSSHYEKEIKDLFPTIDLKKDRTILNGKEIDLYAPDYKIGIEFNGNYWHSDAVHPDKNYHLNKTALAQKKGVFLYHIFEYEWNNPITKKCIVDRLKTLFHLNTYRIYARKCTLHTVSPTDAAKFYTENHLQGKCPAQVHLGLCYKNELVAVMSFKTNGINKHYEWELCRYACKSGCVIPGAASKLFNYFLKIYNPKTIVSYSDIAKTTGKIYSTLGFISITKSHPQYVWVNCGTNCQVWTRYQTQLKNLIKLGWKKKDDGLTEEAIMHQHKFYRIYDCGKCVWVWSKHE